MAVKSCLTERIPCAQSTTGFMTLKRYSVKCGGGDGSNIPCWGDTRRSSDQFIFMNRSCDNIHEELPSSSSSSSSNTVTEMQRVIGEHMMKSVMKKSTKMCKDRDIPIDNNVCVFLWDTIHRLVQSMDKDALKSYIHSIKSNDHMCGGDDNSSMSSTTSSSSSSCNFTGLSSPSSSSSLLQSSFAKEMNDRLEKEIFSVIGAFN